MRRYAITGEDRRYMRLALELAARVKGATFPNPAVGAMVVRGGKVVGTGATAPWGGPHAERTALDEAGPRARGADLYVTLEPCCHHGRTPPCTDAIIQAGIARVFSACRDPNPLVSGRGEAVLRAAGIQVVNGPCGDEAARLNEDFMFSATCGSPWISVKLAMTIDGRIADAAGESRWITSKRSRAYVQELRRRHAAVAVGRGTLVADDPRLTVRGSRGSGPARIVFSSSGQLSPDLRFCRDCGRTRSIVVVSGGAASGRERRPDGLELWHTGSRRRPESFRSFLRMAHEEQLSSILVEGGSRLASFLLEQGLVNRAYFFWAPRIIGRGLEAVRFGRGLSLGEAIRLRDVQTMTFDDDVMMTGLLERRTL
jgi:diaminohydroxyphosphoribosylaminopyrimidine deaminase/5-amino-6-(5-phosphoribosylamino)uracil reductase